MIGCSFSRWRTPGKINARCWPESLAKLNSNIDVWNYSMFINSPAVQYLEALHFLQHDNVDAIVIQWTTFHRASFINHDNEFKLDPFLLPMTRDKDISPNYVHIPRDQGMWHDPFKENKAYHFNAGSLSNVTKKDFKKNPFLSIYRDLLMHGVGSSGVVGAEETVYAYQNMLKTLSNKLNIPVLQFNWFHTEDRDLYRNLVDFEVETQFDFKKYIADEGYHFGNPGADRLAKYINSWIIDNV